MEPIRAVKLKVFAQIHGKTYQALQRMIIIAHDQVNEKCCNQIIWNLRDELQSGKICN